jgi:hypothetical protein
LRTPEKARIFLNVVFAYPKWLQTKAEDKEIGSTGMGKGGEQERKKDREYMTRRKERRKNWRKEKEERKEIEKSRKEEKEKEKKGRKEKREKQ